MGGTIFLVSPTGQIARSFTGHPEYGNMVELDGESVYSSADERDCAMFAAELAARIKGRAAEPWQIVADERAILEARIRELGDQIHRRVAVAAAEDETGEDTLARSANLADDMATARVRGKGLAEENARLRALLGENANNLPGYRMAYEEAIKLANVLDVKAKRLREENERLKAGSSWVLTPEECDAVHMARVHLEAAGEPDETMRHDVEQLLAIIGRRARKPA